MTYENWQKIIRGQKPLGKKRQLFAQSRIDSAREIAGGLADLPDQKILPWLSFQDEQERLDFIRLICSEGDFNPEQGIALCLCISSL